MSTCQTCAHWERWEFLGNGFGRCEAVEDWSRGESEQPPDRPYIGCDIGDALRLMTPPDFGCTRHEPSPAS